MPEKKVRFGEFELNFGRFQLSRSGEFVPLEGLPLQLLMFLVENQQQVVTREQIAHELWGKDVFVDVEQGINTAIRKIRVALGDDPARPQYVRTKVGRGYHFVAVTNWEQDVAAINSASVGEFRFSAEELGMAIKGAAELQPEDV